MARIGKLIIGCLMFVAASLAQISIPVEARLYPACSEVCYEQSPDWESIDCNTQCDESGPTTCGGAGYFGCGPTDPTRPPGDGGDGGEGGEGDDEGKGDGGNGCTLVACGARGWVHKLIGQVQGSENGNPVVYDRYCSFPIRNVEDCPEYCPERIETERRCVGTVTPWSLDCSVPGGGRNQATCW